MSTASIILKDGTISVNRGNRFRDRTGDIYGQLKVVKLDSVSEGQVRWVCLCSCGKTKSILARALNQGQLSCGCIVRESLVGKRFSRLTVIADAGTKKYGVKNVPKVMWKCRCDCGKEAVISGDSLRTGGTKSCGCLMPEAQFESHFKHGATMGGNRKREYRVWANMKTRCSNPKANNFHNYGGRGIKVCKRWLNSFENFYEDIGDCPPGLSLERKDNNIGYCKSNCKWDTAKNQANNMRANRLLECGEKTQSMARWADDTKIGSSTIAARIDRYGWSVERALTTPIKIHA